MQPNSALMKSKVTRLKKKKRHFFKYTRYLLFVYMLPKLFTKCVPNTSTKKKLEKVLTKKNKFKIPKFFFLLKANYIFKENEFHLQKQI